MLKKLQRLPIDMALVAHTSVQFVDYGFVIGKEFSRRFLERLDTGPAGQSWVLRRLDASQDSGDYVDQVTREPVRSDATYSIQVRNALAAYDGMWLPTPFLKVKGTGIGAGFEKGPSNWARIRIAALDAADDDGYTHRLTVAFDTRTDPLRDGDAYTCPRPDDMKNESRFKLATDLFGADSWFLDEPWVQGWLKATLDRSIAVGQAKRQKRDDQEWAACSYWANYCVVIEALTSFVNGETSNAPLPTVRFLDTISSKDVYRPIDVDLVLDIGNSRTCGVLIESDGGTDVNLAKSTRLELRDLSRPQFTYREPFRSHVEFAFAEFGLNYYSRLAGRQSAFSWPSLVRVGPEALRLNSASTGAEGDTGLSGPKRYLWDDREHRQLWYFNTAEQWAQEPTFVFGELLRHMTQDGRMLADSGSDAQPAFQPRFSKASLFCLMVVELLLQAMSQINAPWQRARTATPNVPRHLKRIVLTIPTGTPLLERSRFQTQCDNAVKLLWSVMRWTPNGIFERDPPKIDIAYDEATCTQLVWLYSEMREKFATKPLEFVRIMGPQDAAGSRRTLRVASLDIGGGTTDLMITTYAVDLADDALLPTQNFREGFRRAGDDILEAIISVHVLGAIGAALTRHGVSDTRFFMKSFMQDAGKSAVERHKRKLFVGRLLVPIALEMLTQYEASGLFGPQRDPIGIADVFASSDSGIAALVEFFEEAAHEARAENFKLNDVAFELDFAAMGKTIEGVLKGILLPLCEVIHRFQVDVLLVTGRPSRLPVVRDLLLRLAPAPPNRTVFMHEYDVGNWYPFSTGSGAIGDPKTTVVVGALLCTLATARNIRDFALHGNQLQVDSIANYIGRLFDDGTIHDEDIIYTHDAKAITVDSRPLVVNNPLSIGYRQLPLQRWPGTPLFSLEIADSAMAGVDRTMPWTVTFARREVDRRETPAAAAIAVEDIRVQSIVDRAGNESGPKKLVLRLQTLKDKSGYWLDTGIVMPI